MMKHTLLFLFALLVLVGCNDDKNTGGADGKTTVGPAGSDTEIQ